MGKKTPKPMVRALNVTFDDEVYAKLEAEKKKHGEITWRDFIILAILKNHK